MRIDPEGKPYLVPWKMRGSLSEIMIYDTTNISNMVFDTNKIYSMLRGLFFWVSSWLFFKSAPGGKRFRKMGFTVSVSIKLWGCGVSRISLKYSWIDASNLMILTLCSPQLLIPMIFSSLLNLRIQNKQWSGEHNSKHQTMGIFSWNITAYNW